MDRSVRPPLAGPVVGSPERRAHHRSRWFAPVVLALLAALVVSSLGSPGAPAALARPLAPAGASLAPAHAAAVAPAPHAASPAAASTDVPCYSLNATICVSVANATVPNIIPPAGSHVSAVQPAANTTINLWVRSQFSLVWAGNVSTSGPHSPLALNATGVLWNGVPYYGPGDGTVWHPTGNIWWSFGPTNVNKSYPFYYGLSFTPKSSSGSSNFFPGMTLTWWIYFVQNTSGVFSHWSSVPFQFTFEGAWPASPYPAAPQYGGPSSAGQDLAVAQSPLNPNFNDSVTVSIATTPRDLLTDATIGGAYLDVLETAPDGATLNASTLLFPVSVSGSQGAVGSTLVLPPTLALSPGALISYRVTAWDTSLYNPTQMGPDVIQTSSFSYTVNGNGSFRSGNFTNDLTFTPTPAVGGTLPAGTSVHLTLTSSTPSTAIEAAQLQLNFSYAGIGETVPLLIPLHRANSTNFVGTIPPLPLGSSVRFQVAAWDFQQTREVSSTYTYSIANLTSLLPTIPSNSTFFVVYVYDNGSHQWVTNAQVQVLGLASSGYIYTVGNTFGGVAYPNATGEPFVPLLLPAATSYRISVNDSAFVPAGSSGPVGVSVTLLLPHAPTRSGVLAVGANYVVAESGPSIYFWLNQTYSPVAYASHGSFGTATLFGAALGLGALTVVGVPLTLWWSTIRARRAEQERRITL